MEQNFKYQLLPVEKMNSGIEKGNLGTCLWLKQKVDNLNYFLELLKVLSNAV